MGQEIFSIAMGRVNKKLAKGPGPATKTGLSGSVLKALPETVVGTVKEGLPPPTTKVTEAEAVVPSDSRLSLEPLRSLATKSGKITKVKKKDKIKMRKQLIRDKLAAAEAVKTEAKQKRKREKTVVVGDVKPMLDHLNIIDELIKEEEEKKKKDEKVKKISKGTLKQKKQKERFMSDFALFNQVRKHEEYVKDPFNTISTHIQNKMLAEAEEMAE